MQLIKTLINAFNFFGVDIRRFPSRDKRRRLKLFQYFDIDTVIDVGANEGAYALELRKLNFDGAIFSFEPLPETFKRLLKKSARDSKWESYNFALGDKNQRSEINISKNSYSSSILDLKPLHLENAPSSKIIDKVEIEVKTLDSIYSDLLSSQTNKIMLKIDAQGYEEQILRGSENFLDVITGLQIELSLEELYHGEMLYAEMIEFLRRRGFKLFSLENGFYSKCTGQLLQVDGIFFKPN